MTFKHLPESALATVEFINKFGSLFNASNSHTFRNTQPCAHAFSNSTNHIESVKETLKYLNKFAFREHIHIQELSCIWGWKLCSYALFGLWEHLKETEKYRFLLTSRLNHDCAENLFSVIRGKGGYRDNPNVEQFRNAFKYVVPDKLLLQSKGSNHKVDSDKILLDVTNVVMAKYRKPIPVGIEKPLTTDIPMVIQPPSFIPSQSVVAYLAGDLLRKIPMYDCSKCLEEQILPELPPDFSDLSFYVFIRNKPYQEEGCLLYPSLRMVTLATHLKHFFMPSLSKFFICNLF